MQQPSSHSHTNMHTHTHTHTHTQIKHKIMAHTHALEHMHSLIHIALGTLSFSDREHDSHVRMKWPWRDQRKTPWPSYINSCDEKQTLVSATLPGIRLRLQVGLADREREVDGNCCVRTHSNVSHSTSCLHRRFSSVKNWFHAEKRQIIRKETFLKTFALEIVDCPTVLRLSARLVGY